MDHGALLTDRGSGARLRLHRLRSGRVLDPAVARPPEPPCPGRGGPCAPAVDVRRRLERRAPRRARPSSCRRNTPARRRSPVKRLLPGLLGGLLGGGRGDRRNDRGGRVLRRRRRRRRCRDHLVGRQQRQRIHVAARSVLPTDTQVDVRLVDLGLAGGTDRSDRLALHDAVAGRDAERAEMQECDDPPVRGSDRDRLAMLGKRAGERDLPRRRRVHG